MPLYFVPTFVVFIFIVRVSALIQLKDYSFKHPLITVGLDVKWFYLFVYISLEDSFAVHVIPILDRELLLN